MNASRAAALLAASRFRHRWRPYQARVLSSLDHHLTDDRLHIVAPPGSGKTVLGLEVLRRLGRPALVLAPTLTIREQWITRSRSDFTELGADESAISRNLRRPALLTVATYQALNQVHGEAEVTAALRASSVETLVVDEAHHLRRVWWNSLEWLSAELDERTRVALTATPPYDVPQQEWNRYLGFCGPIDEEIAAPVLVRENNLCAHQDYLYLSRPTDAETERLLEWHAGTTSLVNDIGLDLELANGLATIPMVTDPKSHRLTISEHIELFLAITIFLGNLRREAVMALVREINLEGVRLPLLDLAWSEVLLGGVLFGPFELPARLRSRIRQRLAALDAIHGRAVHLRASRRRQRLLARSVGKRRSIRRIVEHESAQLGDSLRLVVLADHIHDAALTGEVERIGVVPIFQDLRRLRLAGLRPAVLSGRLVIVPRACESALTAALGIRQLQPLAIDPEYSVYSPRGEQRHRLVAVVSELFSRGAIRALIGTAALLGEGWDEPAINTLVLATVIGSYVTSNQMRGRALRVDEGTPNKVANIWHLASIDSATGEGEDIERLRRRFDAFLGLPIVGEEITTGLARLGDRKGDVDAWNATMVKYAAQRGEVLRQWRRATGEATSGRARLIRELEIPAKMLNPSLIVGQRPWPHGWLVRLRWWWAKRQLVRMAMALAEAYEKRQMVKPPRSAAVAMAKNRVEVRQSDEGWEVSLPDAEQQLQWRFVDGLAQVYDLMSSPRYLLRRGQRYWAVPESFAKNKRRAQPYAAIWCRHLGRYELIFTGNERGRLHLAAAKERALLKSFELRTTTRMRWG